MFNLEKRPDEVSDRDHDLVERARNGSGAAFAKLVARHREAVHVIVRNMSATSRDAEERIAQVFLTAWRDLESLPAGARFTTWLYAIAMRTVLERRQAVSPMLRSALAASLPTFDATGRLVESSGLWSQLESGSSERAEITGLLREALEYLDDRIRAAFVLCDLLGISAEEAAVILERSPPTLRANVHQARVLLRGFIDRL